MRKGVFWLFENAASNNGVGGWLAVIYINNFNNITKYPGLNELALLSKNKFVDNAVIYGGRIYLITKYKYLKMESLPKNKSRRDIYRR